MKVEDALYHAVHDYPGGAGSLAPRMNLAAPTLYAMANPRDSSHEWPLRRFRQVLAMTGDLRPLAALCEENHGVFVGLAATTLPDAFRHVSKLAAEFGDVVRGFEDAMKDGRITPRECDAIDTQIYGLIAAAAGLGQRLRQESEQHAPVRVVK